MVFDIKIVDLSSFSLIIEEELKTKNCTKKKLIHIHPSLYFVIKMYKLLTYYTINL